VEENIFFENGNIKVTNARFVVGDQTYAMASVNSVKVSSTDITSSRTFPTLVILAGLVWLPIAFLQPSDISRLLWPALVLVAGCLWAFSIKKTIEYKIILTTSSGEAAALKSTDGKYIYSVEKALHDSIIFRG